ncbi:MAG: DUF1538 domain-containing protein [Bacilli bacterium]
MRKQSFKNLLDALVSVSPVVLIVLVLFLLQEYTDIFPSGIISFNLLITFLICSLFLVVGMSLYSLGSEVAMSQVGKYIGNSFGKSSQLIIMLILMFLLGIMITIAEPSISVLTGYIPAEEINPWLLKIIIGVGVGAFFLLGFLRILFQKSLRLWLMFFYMIVFGIACLFGGEGGPIIELAIDSGAATTGSITVPFLIAFGVGLASARGGKNSTSDSFGLVGLCSVGPIIVVMLLGIILEPQIKPTTISTDISVARFTDSLLSSIQSVCFAILPIVAFFLIYELICIKLPKKEIIKICLGFLYTAVGLIIFLTAANFGFIPIGYSLGSGLAMNESYFYLLVILSIIIGFVIVLVEPSVIILTQQVEEISNGGIPKKKLRLSLGISVSIAVFLSTIRVLYFPTMPILYYIVPLYIVALGLTMFVPDIYVGIAFDAGGVASGTMSNCFVTPFILGIGATLNNGASGFGVIGLIATMPLIVVQGLGVVARIQSNIEYKKARERVKEVDDNQIIHLMEVNKDGKTN